MKDVDDRDVQAVADYKGKVIVLDFWATWCVPCKAEIPWFVEFQKQYGAQGLQVVGVSVDDTVDKLKPYRAATGRQDELLRCAAGSLIGHDDVQDALLRTDRIGIPVTAVLISQRDGKICASHTGSMGTKADVRN